MCSHNKSQYSAFKSMDCGNGTNFGNHNAHFYRYLTGTDMISERKGTHHVGNRVVLGRGGDHCPGPLEDVQDAAVNAANPAATRGTAK